jgi:4-hydroxy-L-threonine phosphate dehydrogenase PdxA
MTPSPSVSRVAITMGDPAGVGPEVVMAALSTLPAEERRLIVVVGDRTILERAGHVVGSSLRMGAVGDTGDDIVAVEQVTVPGLVAEFGKLHPTCGEAAFRYIERAVRLTEGGLAAGIVTAPINKEALNAAGHKYDGHTGMLACSHWKQAVLHAAGFGTAASHPRVDACFAARRHRPRADRTHPRDDPRGRRASQAAGI